MKFPQPSFTAGELSPSLYSRTDLAKFHSGAKKIQNFIVLAEGGIANRPGLKFVGEIDGTGRLIPFEFNTDQTYALVFTDELLQVVKDGGFVLDGAGPAIYEIASPYAVEDLPLLHYAQSQDTLFLTHLDYTPYALTRADHDDWTFTALVFESQATPPVGVVAAPPGAAAFQNYTYQIFPYRVTGNEYDTSGSKILTISVGDPFTGTVHLQWINHAGTYTGNPGGDRNACIFRNGSFYRVATDLGQFGSFNDVDQGVSGTPPSPASFAPKPTDFAASYNLGSALVRNYQYGVSAVVNNDESFISDVVAGSAAIPWPAGDTITITWDPVTNAALYNIYKNANGQWGWIGTVDMGATLSQPIVNAISDGSTGPYILEVTAHGYTTGDNVRVYGVDGFTDLESDATYAIVVIDPDHFSLVGTTSGGALTVAQPATANVTINSAPQFQLIDDNILPDVTYGIRKSPVYDFTLDGQHPKAVSLFQQRLVFANSNTAPTTIWASRSGSLLDFSISDPPREDDPVVVIPASGKVNAIRHLVPLNDLLTFTAGSEITLRGADGALRANNAQFDFETYIGCTEFPAPVPISKSILFVQRDGKRVHDYNFKLEVDGYSGNGMNALATHVFADSKLIDWAYQQSPSGVLWCVREDGALRGFTYLREHEVYAWHRHDTQGQFRAVCSISGEGPDEVYFIVEREVDGDPVFYVETFHERVSQGGCFLDSSLSYTGSPVTTVSGLDHLEGMTVNALADGNVVTGLVVASGAVTLPQAASAVHVGLAYTSIVESLDLDMNGENQGKKQKLNKLVLRMLDSRGGFVGPSTDTTKQYAISPTPFTPSALFSGDKEELVRGEWGRACKYVIRQESPLPMTILAVIPDVETGS